jgi:hypothetical protein
MNTFHRLTTVLLIALLAVLAGCVQVAPIPAIAHAGDTITLGLGGINRNWGGEKPRNLQITITDAANQTFPLEIAVIFQAYPDYRSGANVLAFDGSDGMNLQPFDGAWFVAAGLGDILGPHNLAPGPATLHVTADNLTVARDGLGQLFTQEGDLSQIPIEIIAGPPSPSDSVAQFGAYDSRSSHFVVRPAASSGATLGGAYYAIQYQSDSEFGTLKPMALPVSHNPFVKMDYKIQENGNGSGTYFIYVYNPAGFTAAAPRQPKQAPLQDLGIYFEYFNTGSTEWMQSHLTLDTANSYFIDIDGNRIQGLQAEMLHASQL